MIITRRRKPIIQLKKKPNGYWNNSTHQLEFFDRLYGKLGYKSMDDWYNVTTDDIRKNGGAGLLSVYNDSPSAALQRVYPHHKWDLHKFVHKPKRLQQDHSDKL